MHILLDMKTTRLTTKQMIANAKRQNEIRDSLLATDGLDNLHKDDPRYSHYEEAALQAMRWETGRGVDESGMSDTARMLFIKYLAAQVAR